MRLSWLLLALAALSSSGCASQQELARLQAEADDLQRQLAYEKQRLKTIRETGKDIPPR